MSDFRRALTTKIDLACRYWSISGVAGFFGTQESTKKNLRQACNTYRRPRGTRQRARSTHDDPLMSDSLLDPWVTASLARSPDPSSVRAGVSGETWGPNIGLPFLHIAAQSAAFSLMELLTSLYWALKCRQI